MTQTPGLDRWPLSTCWGPSHTRDPMDSQRVCEIVGQVAAEVLAEVRAGTWRPPTTLNINPRVHGSPGTRGRRPDRIMQTENARGWA